MAFGAGNVDSVGVPQRRLSKGPATPDVSPWRGFDRDLESFRIEEYLFDLVGLQRVTGPVRCRHETRQDFDGKMAWRAEGLGGWMICKRLTGSLAAGAGVGEGVNDNRGVNNHV